MPAPRVTPSRSRVVPASRSRAHTRKALARGTRTNSSTSSSWRCRGALVQPRLLLGAIVAACVILAVTHTLLNLPPPNGSDARNRRAREQQQQQFPHYQPRTVLPRPPKDLALGAAAAAAAEANAHTTVDETAPKPNAATVHLRPGYGRRVAAAIANARWLKPRSAEDVQETLAHLLQVDDPAQWPPGGFVQGHESSCWRPRESHEEVVCLPRFRLLGVAKCGTTSLSDHIGKHPGSLPSVPDVRRYELHFLTKRGHSNGTLENHIRQAAWPWSQAVAAAPTKVYGDGTPQLHRYNHGYWVPGIGELLQHTTTTKGSGEEGEEGEGGEYDDDDYDDGDEEMESPTGSHYVHTAELASRHGKHPVRYLVTVREPVARLYSAFRFYVEQLGKGRKSLPNYKPSAAFFHTYVLKNLAQFQDCLFDHEVADAMVKCVVKASKGALYSLAGSMYYPHLRQWLELTRTELHRDVMVTSLEERVSPDKGPQELNHIFYFLGLRTLSPPEMAMHRTTQEVTRVNSGHDRVKELFGPMLPETKELLQAVFAPFNAALAEFVGNPALCYNDDDDEADNEDQG